MNKKISLFACIEWALRAGLTIRFYIQRSANQRFFCCTLESKIGNKVKTYEIKELSLYSCVHHVVAKNKDIFLELNCPPLSLADILKE